MSVAELKKILETLDDEVELFIQVQFPKTGRTIMITLDRAIDLGVGSVALEGSCSSS